MIKCKYHYVYAICNKINRKCYIGARSSAIKPELDLGIKYKSSSKDKSFMEEQKTNKSNFKYLILKTFDTRVDAIDYEILLHNVFDVVKNENFYNRAKQTSTKFDTSGKMVAIDENGNLFQISTNDPRLLSGELKGIPRSEECKKKISENHTGRINGPHSEETKRKMSNAAKGHEVTTETRDKLSTASKGKVNVIDKDGNTFAVDKTDPRWLSGELVAQSKGRIVSEEAREKRSIASKGKVSCIDKLTGEKITVLNTDPRYLSGQLVAQSAGRKQTEEGKAKRRASAALRKLQK